jgi:hypothetical protein
MEELHNRKKPALSAGELEQVTGGTAWNDDIEAIENIRRPEDPADDGIVREPSGKKAPVSAAGLMDRLALGMDRIKEDLTSKATRR